MNRIKTKKAIRLIFVLGSILIFSILLLVPKVNQIQTRYKPVNGILNLSGWNSEMRKPSLIGEWEFYWNQLLSSQDFTEERELSKEMVHVPKTWDTYEVEGKPLPGFGYATYRLKVIVDDPLQELSLRIDTMSTSYSIFVDDKKIASNGTVGVDMFTSTPHYQPMFVDFLPPAESFDLIVQVSNFTYASGGIWYEINLGTHEQISGLNSLIIYKDALLIGSLLIMALYYASFYFVLQKDKSSLYFMLLCIVFITRTSIYGDALISRIFPNISFDFLIFLTYCTLYWIPVVIFLMVDSIYDGKIKLKYRKTIVLYGIISTLLTAILPIQDYTKWITLIEIIGIAIVVFALSLVIKAYLSGEKGAGLILLAVFVILGTGVHDVLYQANILHNSFGELASIGIFIFMFTFAFIIASRFSNAFDRSKRLTLQLADALEKEKASANELITTELSFLKAQIKPHFIYNSLSVIAALILEEPQKAKALLYNLTDYLRGSFNFDNESGLAPLIDELETVKAYVAIEKARFQDKLHVEYELEDNLSISIPLLTIQPLVENAIRHGILKKPEGGKITIRTFNHVNDVVIQVEDNGVGLEKSKLEHMLLEEGSTKGVGIKNINRRLKLFYKTNLEIQSEVGNFTKVTIRIPKNEGVL